MKHAICLLLLFLQLSTYSLFAQDTTCNCLVNLNELVTATEKNYAGYPVKVNAQTKNAYQALVQQLRVTTAAVANAKSCYYLLKQYIRFFNDKHFTLSYDNDKDYDREIELVNESAFRKKLALKNSSGVEGIWQDADGKLKLAVQQDARGRFKGIVLESEDSSLPVGLVYFILTPTKNGFIAKKYDWFVTTDLPAKQKGNLLQIWNKTMFGKIYPSTVTAEEQSELDSWKNNNNGLAFRQLSAKTTYIKIPTFYNNDDKIAALIAKNDSIIRASENLIIDLTGNGGGNTGWVPLLPYMLTNPIVQYPSYVRVTAENVKYKLADLEPFVVNEIPAEYKKYFPEDILAAYKKAYNELPVTKEQFYPVPGVTFPLDSVLPLPEKVAILVDDMCGSSTEYFFFLSKQSKKVRTYGIPTIGMMDYEGMSYPTPLSYSKFIVTIPIVQSSWTSTQPIDRTGFRPDNLLYNIPPAKWVKHVQHNLEHK